MTAGALDVPLSAAAAPSTTRPSGGARGRRPALRDSKHHRHHRHLFVRTRRSISSYNPNGTLDASFGAGGLATVNAGSRLVLLMDPHQLRPRSRCPEIGRRHAGAGLGGPFLLQLLRDAGSTPTAPTTPTFGTNGLGHGFGSGGRTFSRISPAAAALDSLRAARCGRAELSRTGRTRATSDPTPIRKVRTRSSGFTTTGQLDTLSGSGGEGQLARQAESTYRPRQGRC